MIRGEQIHDRRSVWGTDAEVDDREAGIVGRCLHWPVVAVNIAGKPGGETLGSETHIDLTRYDAINCGVSRVHMFLHCLDNQFYVEDVDSRNGTFLNGNAIPSFQMTPVRNGDEIRLGHLRMYIYLIEDTVAVA